MTNAVKALALRLTRAAQLARAQTNAVTHLVSLQIHVVLLVSAQTHAARARALLREHAAQLALAQIKVVMALVNQKNAAAAPIPVVAMTIHAAAATILAAAMTTHAAPATVTKAVFTVILIWTHLITCSTIAKEKVSSFS